MRLLTYNATLNFQGESVSVIVHERGGKIEESTVKALVFGDPWNEAQLENGEIAYFQFLDYEDSLLFRDDIDISKYKAAIEAQLELKKAYQRYKDSMTELGAVKKEEGSYEDYHSWLEIPGIPNLTFPDV